MCTSRIPGRHRRPGIALSGWAYRARSTVPRGSRSMTYAARPQSGIRSASAGTRRRPGNTPPAEVHLRYICLLTSRYAGWPDQPGQGRTRRDGDGRQRVRPTPRQGDVAPVRGGTAPRRPAGTDTGLGVASGHGRTAPGADDEAQHAVNAVTQSARQPGLPRTPSRNTPLAWPVRGRPWNRRRCAPTVLTGRSSGRTDRPDSTDARPLYVRGQRNMTVCSATR